MTTKNQNTAPVSDADALSDIACGAKLLHQEGDALKILADNLDTSFADALNILRKVEGRVIVTGMGKSGHIGHKIAATMASTGTPAQFVHPGEASHGDLGMVTKQDAVLALSNSGNVAELGDLIAYTRRFLIPLIAITSRRASTLGEAADVVLELPPVGEACPLGLAPTTSTTLMIALGDALAVALYERRGFSAVDYKVFHPGGSLGRKLLAVKNLMHGTEKLPLAKLGTGMSEALLVMSEKGLGCIGIIDNDGKLVGLIADGDLRRHMSRDLLSQSVDDVMTKNPKTIRMDALAAEALGRMNEWKITTLFVTDDGKPVGIIHVHDCLRAGVA